MHLKPATCGSIRAWQRSVKAGRNASHRLRTPTLFTLLTLLTFLTPARAASSNDLALIVEIEGTVEISRAGSPLWDVARLNQPLLPGDRVRTGDRSRAVVRLSDKTVL